MRLIYFAQAKQVYLYHSAKRELLITYPMVNSGHQVLFWHPLISSYTDVQTTSSRPVRLNVRTWLKCRSLISPNLSLNLVNTCGVAMGLNQLNVALHFEQTTFFLFCRDIKPDNILLDEEGMVYSFCTKLLFFSCTMKYKLFFSQIRSDIIKLFTVMWPKEKMPACLNPDI